MVFLNFISMYGLKRHNLQTSHTVVPLTTIENGLCTKVVFVKGYFSGILLTQCKHVVFKQVVSIERWSSRGDIVCSYKYMYICCHCFFCNKILQTEHNEKIQCSNVTKKKG